ncbi:hypothetical protein GC175_23160 [bacterium]|nr:hypothetical protein [bacterium]
MTSLSNFVTYEAFGAIGDGVTDDLPAICAAHAYANEHGLPVNTSPGAIYHLGRQPLTAVIATDVDWNTSRFTIDDTDVNTAAEDHKVPLFEVRSLLEPMTVQINQLTRDQRAVDVHPERDCHVFVENDNKRLYIRRGLNQNNGFPQQDCFILRKDGAIEGDIDWAYDTITRIEARPIDETTLHIRGGIFTTFANRMEQPIGYNYWARNIVITRSNTEIDGLTHYVVGETAVGHPYRGFLSAEQCANITLRNCFATPHKIYSTIGAAGLPVNMGSYDIHANNVVNFHMVNCRMHHICDRTHWGVIATNFCKNIVLEDCVLSRMDTHMGVSGVYTIRRCEFGHMGLNAIGRGLLTVEDSTLYGNAFISLRSDYGSTWEGDLVIRNCRWVPACGDKHWPTLFNIRNDGMHDFGYPCFMPRTITIDGLAVDDANHSDDYTGLYLFTDPDVMNQWDSVTPLTAERPFPYRRSEKVSVRGLSTTSGKAPQVSQNAALADEIVIEISNA